MRKLALASLRQGHRLFFLDEVPTPFGSREWNGLVTAYPDYQGRLLGQSTMIQVPQLTLWMVSGNNITLTPEGFAPPWSEVIHLIAPMRLLFR